MGWEALRPPRYKVEFKGRETEPEFMSARDLKSIVIRDFKSSQTEPNRLTCDHCGYSPTNFHSLLAHQEKRVCVKATVPPASSLASASASVSVSTAASVSVSASAPASVPAGKPKLSLKLPVNLWRQVARTSPTTTVPPAKNEEGKGRWGGGMVQEEEEMEEPTGDWLTTSFEALVSGSHQDSVHTQQSRDARPSSSSSSLSSSYSSRPIVVDTSRVLFGESRLGLAKPDCDWPHVMSFNDEKPAEIAAQLQIDVDDLLSLNSTIRYLKADSRLKPGTRLWVPWCLAVGPHVFARDDERPKDIAAALNMDVELLLDMNRSHFRGLKATSKLMRGTRLRLVPVPPPLPSTIDLDMNHPGHADDAAAGAAAAATDQTANHNDTSTESVEMTDGAFIHATSRDPRRGDMLAWQKLEAALAAQSSATAISCMICGTSEDPHLILLCDREGCSNEAHTHCCGLSSIPPGDWFCPTCQAQEAGGQVSFPFRHQLLLSGTPTVTRQRPVKQLPQGLRGMPGLGGFAPLTGPADCTSTPSLRRYDAPGASGQRRGRRPPSSEGTRQSTPNLGKDIYDPQSQGPQRPERPEAEQVDEVDGFIIEAWTEGPSPNSLTQTSTTPTCGARSSFLPLPSPSPSRPSSSLPSSAPSSSSSTSSSSSSSSPSAVLTISATSCSSTSSSDTMASSASTSSSAAASAASQPPPGTGGPPAVLHLQVKGTRRRAPDVHHTELQKIDGFQRDPKRPREDSKEQQQQQQCDPNS